MLEKDKRVPIGFLRADASDKEIEKFANLIRAAMEKSKKKPTGLRKKTAVGKKKKRIKTAKKKPARS